MKAFILAAGLGSRLAPLTNDKPKALVEVDGKTMLEGLILRLKSVGITKILINTHHHSQLIIDFIKSKEWEGLSIEISDERGELLDTGGAIVKATAFFEGQENILVHNVDIYTEVDFSKLEKQHRESNSLVSLCVRDRDSSRALLFDNNNKLCGWTNKLIGEFKWVKGKKEDYKSKAYSGVYIASPDFARKIPFKGNFSIIETWLKMAETEIISAYNDSTEFWFDLGTVDKIRTAESQLEKKKRSRRFLEKVASEMKLMSQEDLLKTAVILPNKRSVTYLKQYLNDGRVNPFWLPEFFSIDEFMEGISGINKADPLNLYFDLLNIYLKKEGTNAKSIDSFLSWAPMIIRDFNDIDLYLSSAKEVLRHITEARAIAEWNLDQRELTDLQKSYINFYQSLFPYYEELCLLMKERAYAYTGFIYRFNAENIEELMKSSAYDNFLFVGFNALSPSEEKVFTHVKDNYNTSVFIDADRYYIDNKSLNIPIQETGVNLKRLLNKWNLKEFNWLTDRLVKDEKNINFYEVQGQLGQAKLAGTLLKTKIKDFNENPNLSLINDTAIILADENLLIPLLSSLPIKTSDENENLKYNVTLGYPITNSPLKGLLYEWFEILGNKKSHPQNLMRSQSILNLFQNNVLASALSEVQKEQISLLSTYLFSNNISYISYDEILRCIKPNKDNSNELINILFSEFKTTDDLLKKLIDLLLILNNSNSIEDSKNSIISEQINLLLKISKRFIISTISDIENLDIKTLSSIFFQLLSSYEVSLKGEPLDGIQIMGMLETRALDFNNIIILSANEGIIPQSGLPDSFIPFDIRHNYGLPLPKDKTSVLSYHFFRLLQFAKNIDIIYDTSSEGLGVGEPSRLLRQIEIDLCEANPKIKLKKHSLNLPSGIGTKAITIKKTNKAIKILAEKAESGFSPSLLNTYLACKLKFYFQYILKLEKENEIEISVESHTFGSIIHDSLEELYSPFVGKTIDREKLGKNINNLDTILTKFFLKHYKTINFKHGKNLLIWEVSKKYIENFIKSELSDFKNKQRYLVSVEEKIKIEFNTDNHKVFLKGIIDRVDSDLHGQITRIIDYKTGMVNAYELKSEGFDELIHNKKYAKAFQVLFYKYIYLKSLNKKDDDKLKTGIISLRNLSAGFMEFGLKKQESYGIDEFELLLKSLIDEIFDLRIDFNQTEDTDVCKYCDFTNICNK